MNDLSLRARIVLGAAITGAILGIVFAAASYFAFDRIEESFVEHLVQTELDAFIARHHRDPTATSWTSASLDAYAGELPAQLANLPVGTGEFHASKREYQYELRVLDDTRYLMTYDETSIETAEFVLALTLGFGTIAITILATWVGYALSLRLLAPVTRLAAEVRELASAPDRAYDPDGYSDDEIGMLAYTFARYQHGQQAFLERERRFTGDVSHELRTPLTVVRTALDLLASDPGLDASQLARVERARRGATDIEELIGTFLMLARGGPGDADADARIDLGALVTDVVDETRRETGGEVELAMHAEPRLRGNRRAMAVVVRNLIHNALTHGAARATVVVAADRVTVEDDGPGLAASRAEGGGLGLAIVSRLCERFGWRLELRSADVGTRASVVFTES